MKFDWKCKGPNLNENGGKTFDQDGTGEKVKEKTLLDKSGDKRPDR